jgi:hypothetical protein
MMRAIKRSKAEIPGNLSNRPGSSRNCPRRRISAASRNGSETMHGQQINRLRGKVTFLSLMLLLQPPEPREDAAAHTFIFLS